MVMKMEVRGMMVWDRYLSQIKPDAWERGEKAGKVTYMHGVAQLIII